MTMKRTASVIVLSMLLVMQFSAQAQETKASKVETKAPVAASQPVVTSAATPQPAVAAPQVSLDPTVAAPWWKVLIRYGLELVFTILGLLASVFVTILMKKYGFEDYSAKVNDALIRGIGFAEQKSLQALKLNGKPLDSAEKLALALDIIAEKAKEYKLPDKGKEWWAKKVEGWLGVQKVTN